MDRLRFRCIAAPLSVPYDPMPRVPRGQIAGDAYHVLNRGNGGAVIFHGVAGLESSLRPRGGPATLRINDLSPFSSP
jgi:hypothetical protein